MPRRISIDITISSPKKSMICDKDSAAKVTVGIYHKKHLRHRACCHEAALHDAENVLISFRFR